MVANGLHFHIAFRSFSATTSQGCTDCGANYSQTIIGSSAYLSEAFSRRFVITRRPSYPKSFRTHAAYPIIIYFPRAGVNTHVRFTVM